jgi:toxin ParE1/3/4
VKQPVYGVQLAAPASRDFIEIMDWTIDQFGLAAADRYEVLIGQALMDVGESPLRPGAKQRPELPAGVYTYHLSSSRDRVTGDRVNAPRHFLLYRVVSLRVEVLRILHDSRDLASSSSARRNNPPPQLG